MKEIRKPAFMQRAMQGTRGHIAIIEILIAVAVFGVSFIAMGIIQFPLMFVEMMSNQEYMNLIIQGDQQSLQAAMDIAMDIPEWVMIITLLSEVLMILVVVLYCRFLEKRKPDTMGFQKKGMVRWYLMGMLGGFLFFTVAYIVCVLTGSIHFDGVSKQIAPLYIVGYLAGYMIQGMAEEVLCRGYLFVSLSKRHSIWYSAVLSAAFFAVLHGMNPGLSVLAVFNLILFGVLAALMMVKYENIWIVGAFHSVWNFVQGNLYGIQVSGNSLQQSIFASTCKKDFSFINGGTFGMEGGLAVTLVLGIGIAYLFWALQKDGKIIKYHPQNMGMIQNGNMPQGDGMFQNGNMPQDDGMFRNGNMPQDDGMFQNGNMPQGDRMFQNGNMPQDDGMFRNGNMPQNGGMFQGEDPMWGGNMPQGEGMAENNGNFMNRNISMGKPKRENMGVAPNETPWHPEQTGESSSGQKASPFNADYFKD